MKEVLNSRKPAFFSWKKLGLSFLIVVLILLAIKWVGDTLKPPAKVGSARQIGLEQLYPLPWRSDFDLPIARSLGKNGVTGCGEFQYRESSQHSREYLVYCTRDGSTWTAYLVWSSTEKIIGPMAPTTEVTLPLRR